MNAPFQFTPQATEDLDAIWWFIAEENRDAADRNHPLLVLRPERAVGPCGSLGFKRVGETPPEMVPPGYFG
jgi:hypothetical protein